jgi:hypothetical protein
MVGRRMTMEERPLPGFDLDLFAKCRKDADVYRREAYGNDNGQYEAYMRALQKKCQKSSEACLYRLTGSFCNW